MERAGIRGEERTGLMVALVLHLLVLAALVLQTLRPVPAADKPERMVVSLAEEVGLEATAPEPVPESAAATAPRLAPEPGPAPAPAPVPDIPPPQPVRVERPAPPAPLRTQAPRARPAPAQPRAAAAPRRETAQPAPARSAAARPAPARPAERSGGGSRIGDDFLAGAGNSTTTRETRPPASAIGASAKASLISQIVRELRPNFTPPSGVDVDKLVSVVSFRLNADGSLAGTPRLVRQTGKTDANAPQQDRHAELAIRAVQLAAPFDLPAEYHDAFKTVTINFDASL